MDRPHTPSKPRLLIFPFDLLSHHTRCIQLAKAIQDQADVWFAHSSTYAPLIHKAGFQTFPCESFDANHVITCAKNFDFSWLEQNALLRVCQSQIAAIEQFCPTAVLSDTAPTLSMAAEATRMTHIALMNGYMTKHYACVRKIARIHPAARYEPLLSESIFNRIIQLGEWAAFRQVHRPFKKIRRQLGLMAKRTYPDELEGHHTLICDLPDLFPQKNLPDTCHIIGPLYYETGEPEPEILAFLNNDRPNLFVSAGSSGKPERFAFLNRPAFKACHIVAAGVAGKYVKGSNVISKPFVNASAILENIDLVICHGGNGSIYQALAYGIPVVCATGMFEQEWNVQRLVATGLGASLDHATTEAEMEQITLNWLNRKNTPPFQAIRKTIHLQKTKDHFRTFWNGLLKEC